MDRKRIESILQHHVDQIDLFHQHGIVQTTDGRKWMVKKIDRPEHLTWWSSIDRELRMRGFLSMPSFYTDYTHYVLTPWIHGQIGSYRDLDQAVTMIKRLARFHQVGTGLQTPPKQKQEAAFLLYDRIYSRLKQFYRLMGRADQIPGKVGRFLREMGPLFYQDGYFAWKQLLQFPICLHTDWSRQKHCLAHRDLAGHNWLIDKRNQIWLIDFDTADYDSQLGDLWQMVTRILSEQNWSTQAYLRLLESYESIRPLNELEKRMLTTLLAFPNEFFREAIGLCMRKPGYHYRSTFPYLQRIAKNRQHWIRQTTHFSSW